MRNRVPTPSVETNRHPAGGQRALAKEKIWIVLILFLVIPATIAVGVIFLSDRFYLLMSLLILLETMIPFFVLYEGRKPRAREVVMIAVLSALVVVGDLVSFSVLPLQIGTGMVILSGIAFGPEAGFLVGALARLIVNFFNGQGAWTPWQMFAWGMLGFLGGLCFNRVAPARIRTKRSWLEENRLNVRSFRVVLGPVLSVLIAEGIGFLHYLVFPMGDKTFFGWRVYIFGAAGLLIGALLQRKRLPADNITLTVFTFLAVLILYGGTMNLCTLVTTMSIPGSSADGKTAWDALRMYFISGLPYDLWHAFRAALMVFIFGNSILRRLERVKVKYGFYR